MWGDRKRRKSKLEGKVVTEVALLSGIFYSKFRFKLNSVSFSWIRNTQALHRARPLRGCLCFTMHLTKARAFTGLALDKPVSRFRFSHWKIYVWKEFMVISCNHQKGTVGLLNDQKSHFIWMKHHWNSKRTNVIDGWSDLWDSRGNLLGTQI